MTTTRAVTISKARTISKVLVANRGEIAVRVIRAAADLGIASVAVYADSDAEGLAARLADEAFALTGVGASPYLDGEQLLQIAARSGADAVHPGYGFLAENAEFARAVVNAGLIWIGPAPDAIDALGDKVRARRIAQQVGAPMAPGSDGPVLDAEAAAAWAAQHGFPVAIKAVHGGGGRGMRVARSPQEVAAQFEAATREAAGAFGRSECFLERYLERPRHVETQCLADQFGEVVVVSTRDCTVQRRHQKLVEEAPAPFLTTDQETTITSASKAILRAASYQGAGTVEFLIGADGTIAFLEVNTRLQVEHPVTEQITGIDMVAEMFRLACGEPIGYSDPRPRGHAFEFRINAEDAARGFVPTPGPITVWDPPAGPGVRVDEGYQAHMNVPPEMDSLIAKLIITGADRDQALRRARRALAEFRVEPVATLVNFHMALLDQPAFVADHQPFAVDTGWVEREFVGDPGALSAHHQQPGTADSDGTPDRERVVVEVAGRRVEVLLPAAATSPKPRSRTSNRAAQAPRQVGDGPDRRQLTPGHVSAPMAGTVVALNVAEGQAVSQGDQLLVLEAMKMEQPVLAPRAGVIADLLVQPGQRVIPGDLLCRIGDGVAAAGPPERPPT